MGSRGGSGFRGGGAEDSGTSLGRAISRISSTVEAGHILYICKIIDIDISKRIEERHNHVELVLFSFRVGWFL
jgi:hypothetical protein